MARTFIRQVTQIRSSDTYDDTVTPSLANFETNPTELEGDLNSIRSMLSHLLDVQAGNWYDVINTPSALETGTQRGVSDLNTDLHALEKKRVLRCVWGLDSITIASAGDTYVVLGAAALPGNLIAAVGAVTTLGTVVAFHSGTFGTASLDEVAGSTAISPKNLVSLVDAATRDPLLDSGGERIYGLLQSEIVTDGHTINTTTQRVQISFVKITAAGTDLEAISSGDMDGKSFDYCYVERVRLEDLNEADFLGGANVDVPAGSTVTRQVAYDNQGATIVTTAANATLDIGAGLSWELGDNTSAALFTVTEGNVGSNSEVAIGAAVDLYDNDAIDVDFASGVTIRSGGTRPIDVGVTDGVIESTAGDLMVKAAAELYFDDVNQTGSTWAQDGIKLSDTTAEWDNFESAFGEVSLLNAIVQAANPGNARLTKTYANVTSTTVADTDVGGTGGGANLDAQLPDMSTGTFLQDYDVFLNGALLRPGADATANNDYYPGTSLALGQLKFEFPVVLNDVIAVVAYS